MRILVLAAALAAGLSTAACSTLPGLAGGASTANSALAQFLTDPNCAHHDEATLVTGAAGVPASFQAKLVRDCVARPVSDGPVAPPVPVTATP